VIGLVVAAALTLCLVSMAAGGRCRQRKHENWERVVAKFGF